MKKIESNISMIIPTLNEQEGIGLTITELQKLDSKPYLIVIDGNSIDQTVKIVKSMNIDVYLQNGKGKGNAISQGIEKLDSNIHFIGFIDADFTYPAEYIQKMIEILEQNPTIGMVIGNRFKGEYNSNKASMKTFYFGNKIFAFAELLIDRININDPLSGLRVVRSEIIKDWKPKSRGFDVEVEMNNLVRRKGFKIAETPINYRVRLGEKKLKARDGLKIMERIIIEGVTFKRGEYVVKVIKNILK
jgi:dolichol-phosphate mannosyltransferase